MLFCSYHIVAMMIADDNIYIVPYQIGDWQEVGMYQMTIETGQNSVLKTDNNYVYLAVGLRFAKIEIPSMVSKFVIETEHIAPIIDITITPQLIVTT